MPFGGDGLFYADEQRLAACDLRRFGNKADFDKFIRILRVGAWRQSDQKQQGQDEMAQKMFSPEDKAF
jgi:hypothetical protein